jgi:beta-galactosidase
MSHRTLLAILIACALAALAQPGRAEPSPAADRTPLTYYPMDERAEFGISLNGTWKFKLGPVDAGFAKPEFDDAAWKPIRVPGNWEVQGFEEPTYGVKIPATEGFYRRAFVVPEAWKGRRTFLRFESVSFGFECWINGKRVGGLDSAFNRSEFDVTDFVTAGQSSTIAVRATRRNKGWEFDAHDDWSLSGIQRDVVLFSLPDVRVKDYTITTPLKDGGKAASIAFRGLIENSSAAAVDATLNLSVLDARGQAVASLSREVKVAGAMSEAVSAELPIANPQLWTAETPTLYTLKLDLVSGGQQVHLATQRVGLREITVADGVFRINGKPVKLHGVNHHDLHPATGRAMTREQYEQDLELMKAGNVNAIRMCHYPPQKIFLDLCDEYGIYVLDEVPFADFGAGKEHLGDDSYEDNLFLRARATVGRDKNQTCVVLWTVGNENPYTPLIVRTAGLVKELDPSRPRCLPHPTGKGYFPLPGELNVLDEHYLQTAAMGGEGGEGKAPLLEDIFKHPDVTAPVMMSEFAHAQGQGMEPLNSSWDVIESSDRFMGGCVWLFQDQGLYRRVPAGSYPGLPRVVDGAPLEIGKVKAQTWLGADVAIDTNGAGGKDGIVDADRYPKAGYWAVRRTFSPVVVKVDALAVKAGRQTVQVPMQNRYDFLDLSTVTATWELHVDGRKTDCGPLALHAAPRTATACEVSIDVPDQPEKHDLYLRLCFVDKDRRAIAEQTVRLLASLTEPANPYKSWLETTPAEPIVESNDGSSLTFAAGKSRLQVNRETGNVRFSMEGEAAPIFDGLALRVGRAPQMNETRAYTEKLKVPFWEPYLLSKPSVKSVMAHPPKDGRVTVDVSLQFDREGNVRPRKNAPAHQAIVAEVHLTLSGQGWLDVDYTLSPASCTDCLLELGLAFKVPASATKLSWLGKGPYAVYPAEAEGMERGVYSVAPRAGFDPANRMYFGNRTQVSLAAATDAAGAGLGVACADATVSLEPEKDASYFTHVVRAAGHGQKRKVSLVTIRAGELQAVSGTLRLVPLTAGHWPAVFERLSTTAGAKLAD